MDALLSIKEENINVKNNYKKLLESINRRTEADKEYKPKKPAFDLNNFYEKEFGNDLKK